MEEKAICPYCGGEMEDGSLWTRGMNTFLPEGVKMPAFYSVSTLEKRGAICLPPDWYQMRLKHDPLYACHCPKCKKIIIPYE